LYCTSEDEKPKRMRRAEYVTCISEVNRTYWVSVGKRERRRPLERPRPRWENNIEMCLKKIMEGHGLD
jgi:hypothetical protein